MPSCYAVGAKKALLYAALRAQWLSDSCRVSVFFALIVKWGGINSGLILILAIDKKILYCEKKKCRCFKIALALLPLVAYF